MVSGFQVVQKWSIDIEWDKWNEVIFYILVYLISSLLVAYYLLPKKILLDADHF